jgi:hypothetical protein
MKKGGDVIYKDISKTVFSVEEKFLIHKYCIRIAQ